MTLEFNIHAIGTSGAGKTVFLASMYRSLNLRRAGSVFYLATDPLTSAQLSSTYMKVADPEEDWPEATNAMKEWVFTACVTTGPPGQATTQEPLKFRYIDYPGGVLTNPRALESATGKAISARLRAADALLVMLDGQALLAVMKGEPAGDRFLDFELTATLEIVQQTRCPIHFVITKWDLLQSAKITLPQIRSRLENDVNFRDCIQARMEDTPSPIRLVPVSAVGEGYAFLDTDGAMKKYPGFRPKPINVELPLLAVFPDLARTVFAKEGKDVLNHIRQRELSAAQAQSGNEKSYAAKWKTWTSKVTSYFNLTPWGSKLVGYIDALWELQQGKASRKTVNTECGALALLISEFHQRLDEFEQKEPASRLSEVTSNLAADLVTARYKIAHEISRANRGNP